jgi:hypothetical protein
VVDTPGICYTANDNETIHKELTKSLHLATPGFHAIAFVLKRDKFTAEIQETKDIILRCFGEDVKKYMFIILTDSNTDEEMEAFIRERPHQKLTELFYDCCGRVVPLQNKWKNYCLMREQVICILEMVEDIVAENNGTIFSSNTSILDESYAESDEESPRSLVLEKKNVCELDGTEIKHGRLKYIIEMYPETSSGSDFIEESENYMAKSYADSKGGKLKIIDVHTNKPYEFTTDTSQNVVSGGTSENQSPVNDISSTDCPDPEDDINDFGTKESIVNSEYEITTTYSETSVITDCSDTENDFNAFGTNGSMYNFDSEYTNRFETRGIMYCSDSEDNMYAFGMDAKTYNSESGVNTKHLETTKTTDFPDSIDDYGFETEESTDNSEYEIYTNYFETYVDTDNSDTDDDFNAFETKKMLNNYDSEYTNRFGARQNRHCSDSKDYMNDFGINAKTDYFGYEDNRNHFETKEKTDCLDSTDDINDSETNGQSAVKMTRLIALTRETVFDFSYCTII